MANFEYVFNNEKKQFYIDGELLNQLTVYVRPRVMKKDFDYFCIVDGEEGSGKSVFAMQLAKVLDPTFDISKIAFNAEMFIKIVKNAPANSCIVFDEAFNGMSNRASLSELNRLIVSLMMEMRQKNLFVLIVMPTFFMLDKYVVLHRARALFHIYLGVDDEGNEVRGYWKLYPKDKMKFLYLKGKKYYDYSCEKHRIFGRFFDQYVIDEMEYRRLKKKYMQNKGLQGKAAKFKEQRDILFTIMHDECGLSQQSISDLCRRRHFIIDRSIISDSIALIKESELKELPMLEGIEPENPKQALKEDKDGINDEKSDENLPVGI